VLVGGDELADAGVRVLEKLFEIILVGMHHDLGCHFQKVGLHRQPAAGSTVVEEVGREGRHGAIVGFQKLWRALLKQAKIEDLTAHDLRHHWASVAITDSGLTLKQVGGMLGHLSPLTTDRYAHLMDDGAKDMARRVAGQLSLAQGDTL